MDVPAYLRALADVRAQPEATAELSLREALLRLVREAAAGAGRGRVLVAQEADADRAGQPDVFIKDGPRLLGFVEAKAPGADLRGQLRSTAQLKRYRESLPNWALTDHYRFIFLRDGEITRQVSLANPDALTARAAEVDALREAFADFFAYAPPVLRSPQRLAQELARRARLLRAGLIGLLATEPGTGRLRSVLAFYRQTLMSDMTDADFADTFAQTIAYGMFLGRLSHRNGEYTRQVAIGAIPPSIPFLRSAVRLLMDEELLPAPVLRLLDDLAALLDNTEIEPIRAEVAAGGLERDLVVYFYERFLEQYDKVSASGAACTTPRQSSSATSPVRRSTSCNATSGSIGAWPTPP